MTLNELIPTYGNWGGPGWSGGKRTEAGEAIDWTKKGTDSLDELFKAHDWAYYQAEQKAITDSATAAQIILDADIALLQDISSGNWDSGLYGILYAPLAEVAFAAKSLYDLAQVVSAQLEQLDANDAKGSLAGAAWGMADAVGDLFGSAQGWAGGGGDPLVFDMDADGIEILPINVDSPVLFDFENDGVKTATGWVKSDDALLVLDRNSNGTIDNGSELFGDQTLVNGVKTTDGFAALSAEDTNGDGMLVSFIKPISNNSLYKANLKKMA